MIPKMDPKWSRPRHDPQDGPGMIPFPKWSPRWTRNDPRPRNDPQNGPEMIPFPKWSPILSLSLNPPVDTLPHCAGVQVFLFSLKFTCLQRVFLNENIDDNCWILITFCRQRGNGAVRDMSKTAEDDDGNVGKTITLITRAGRPQV